MKSNIACELNSRFKPIVLLKSDEKPTGGVGPESSHGGCSIAYVARTITERITTFFAKEYATCVGVASGLGWLSDLNEEMLDYQATFLSLGIDSAKDKKQYMDAIQNRPSKICEMFMRGMRYFNYYDTAMSNLKNGPVYDNGNYAVFKAIENLTDDDEPLSVIFTVNPLELSVLIFLDGSCRSDSNYILAPLSSACQSIGSFVFRQAESDNPRPVLGFTDLAARKYLKGIPDEYLTFSVPWKLFLKLENQSKNSIFRSTMWESLKK